MIEDNVSVWSIFAVFVLTLIGFIFWAARLLFNKFSNGDIVQGNVVDDIIKQRDDWKDLAISSADINGKNADSLKQLMTTQTSLVENQNDILFMLERLTAEVKGK